MSYTSATQAPISQLFSDSEIARLFSIEADIAAMIGIEKALAGAQADAGLVPAEHAAAIDAALGNFSADMANIASGFERDGVIPPELVRQIRQMLDKEVAASFHFGATSQDLIDTSLMMRLKMAVGILAGRLEGLDRKLEAMAAAAPADRVLQARTRMQNALPITIAEKIANWRSQIASLAADRPTDFPLQLGGPEGAARKFGDKYRQVAQQMAETLGLTAPDRHWQTNRQPVITIANWVVQAANAAAKIALDVLMMVQTDVAEARLAGGGASSAMPHKQNPVLAEVIVAQARYCQIQLNGMNFASLHENERSGTAWTLEWMLLPQIAEVSAASLANALKLADRLEFTAGKNG